MRLGQYIRIEKTSDWHFGPVTLSSCAFMLAAMPFEWKRETWAAFERVAPSEKRRGLNGDFS